MTLVHLHSHLVPLMVGGQGAMDRNQSRAVMGVSDTESQEFSQLHSRSLESRKKCTIDGVPAVRYSCISCCHRRNLIYSSQQSCKAGQTNIIFIEEAKQGTRISRGNFKMFPDHERSVSN